MIYLIRHTRPDVATDICYGQTDIAVASSFSSDLIEVKRKLPISNKAAILSSPLQRCRMLAQTLFPESTINVDARLMELDFGEWEMQAWKDLDQAALSEWGDNFVTMACPNGESLEDMSKRVISYWESLNHLGQDYVMVTHAGVIRLILTHLLGSPLEKAFTLNVVYGDVIKISFIDHDNCTVRFMS